MRPDADAPDVRALLARAVPDVTPPPDARADLDRGRAALGRRRSLLATTAVGVATALVAVGAVTLPQHLGGPTGAATDAAEVARPDPREPVPLEAASRTQQTGDVVATLLPRGWSVVSADAVSLVVTDGQDGDAALVVEPATHGRTPPVLGGVGDFERLGGTYASYYLLDTSSGAARPSLVFELGHGRWTEVTAPPRLGWGMPELSAFAAGLRAPFACAEPCEVPLAP